MFRENIYVYTTMVTFSAPAMHCLRFVSQVYITQFMRKSSSADKEVKASLSCTIDNLVALIVIMYQTDSYDSYSHGTEIFNEYQTCIIRTLLQSPLQ